MQDSILPKGYNSSGYVGALDALPMKSAGKPAGVMQALTAAEPAAELKETAESRTLLERLERLQAQLLSLNALLQAMADNGSSPRPPSSRRKPSAAVEHARFKKQAKKLTQYAPS